MKNLVLIASLLMSSNIVYADGQSHDHDMKKMEHSHTEMSREDMKSEGKKFEHEHKGKHSPIKMKKEQNMDDTEKMHDHSKMK